MHLADLAEETGVELFVIGSELTSAEVNWKKTNGWAHVVGDRNQKWLDIISEVREHYSGPISYSATALHRWDVRRLFSAPLMGELDYLGVGCGFETRSGNYDPTLSELVAFASERAEDLRMLHNYFSKPVIVFEIGIRSLDGATSYGGSIPPTELLANPDKYPPDFQEQADSYEAMLRTFSQIDWILGIFWDEWMVTEETWRKYDFEHAFASAAIGKPAERVLTSWYGGAPRPVEVPRL